MDQSFITKPLLPENDVTLCAVSQDAEDIIEELQGMGVRVLRVMRSADLPEPLASHADLLVLPLGGDLVAVSADQDELIAGLELESFRVIRVGGLGREYPRDCRLNVLPLGNRLIGNRRAIAEELLSAGPYETVHVNQGYTRCSSVLIDEDTVLTDDQSIGKTVLNFAKYSIIMKQNEVILKGYDHGFIGGSCGKLSAEKIAFAGRIPDSSFGRSLRRALSERGVSLEELGNSPLTDIGGIVPLKQRSVQ